MFEHILHEVLGELWPAPRALDPIEEFLRWDDFRVLNALDDTQSEAAYALRNRVRIYALAAEFNGERDLSAFERRDSELREQYGAGNVWADSQSQLLHRLPLGIGEEKTILVQTREGVVDAREVSDVIAKLSGKAYWRKLFVRRIALLQNTNRRLRGS
jgi:hypothetical protein